MTAQTTKELVDQLHDAGLNLSVTKNGGLSVKPSDRLTDDLRDLIRGSKAALVDWLTTDQVPTLTPEAQIVEYRLYSKLQPPPAAPPATQATGPLDNPVDWRALDKAYQLHHFNCKTCIAAGQGRGMRCGVGASMWIQYSDAAMTPTTVTKAKGTSK